MIKHNLHPLVVKLKQCVAFEQISIAEAARRAGYERSTVRKWFEQGYRPNLETFVDFAQAIGYDVVLVRNRKDNGQA